MEKEFAVFGILAAIILVAKMLGILDLLLGCVIATAAVFVLFAIILWCAWYQLRILEAQAWEAYFENLDD